MSGNFGICEVNGLMRVDYLEKSSLGLDSTIAHEFIHSKLVESTSYGQALNLFRVVSEIDKQYENAFKVLNKNIIKVQEIIANSIEYLLYLKDEGKSKFESKLEVLKLENYEYYKYLMEFEYLIYNENIDIDDKIKIIFSIGRECLNIDLTSIGLEQLKGKKLVKFLSHQDNSLEFLPNSRFKNISKDLKRYLEENEEINFKDINKIIYSLPSPSVENGQGTKNIIKYMKLITTKSSKKNIIHKLLNKLTVVEASIDDLYNLQIAPLNQRYKQETISFKEFSDLEFIVPTVIFCFLEIDGLVVEKALEEDKVPYLDRFRCIYTNIESKTDYTIKDLDLVKILNDKKNIRVVDFDSYINLDYSPMSLLKREPLYVLSFVTYSVLRQSYKYILEKNFKFRILSFEGFNMVIVNLDENINLILLFEPRSYMQFISDLSSKECKFEMISTTDDEPFDDTIFRSEDDIDIYNNIINAYLKA